MNRPSDSAIARAFFDAMKLSKDRAPEFQVAYNFIMDAAREIDARANKPTIKRGAKFVRSTALECREVRAATALGVVDGYAVLRFPRAIPFLIHTSDLLKNWQPQGGAHGR